jgi:inositol-phosphate phosphatase/L-galactose 1-phosphate phosphatase/histidinol-phosphatase
LQAGIIDKQIIALTHQMADAAGEIQLRYFLKSVEVETKADLSPVTLADREVESTLRAMIEAHYPEHGIIGEEFGSVREDAALKWVLDPIDGTQAFIAGIPTFTSLIALTHNGIPIMGMIDQPCSKERWLGIAGENTTLSGNKIHTRPCDSLANATIGTTAMKYFTPEQAEIFEALKNACGNVLFGGDAYLYAGLASGKIDLVVEAGLKPYDYCALRPVVEGAGGIMTDWQGNALKLGSDGRVIAAANAALHAQAMKFLAPSSPKSLLRF